jgi:hypothetical protein
MFRRSVLRGGLGDGLVGRLVITEETADLWVGPPGAPSASERARIERALENEALALRRDIKTALIEREARRNESVAEAARVDEGGRRVSGTSSSSGARGRGARSNTIASPRPLDLPEKNDPENPPTPEEKKTTVQVAAATVVMATADAKAQNDGQPDEAFERGTA